MRNLFLILAFIFLSGSIVFAQSNIHPIDKNELECISKTANTQEMNKCSVIAQKAWESEINNSLNTLKSVLSDEDYTLLMETQQIWEGYKSETFKFVALYPKYNQGTMYQNVEQGFRKGIVKLRALELKEYVNLFTL